MGKRLFIIITIFLFAAMAAGWYFFVRESKYFGTSPLKAVPVESPFFVRIKNLGDFASKTVKNPGWQSMRGFHEVLSLYDDLAFIDSLRNGKNGSANLLSQKEVIIVQMDSSRLYLVEIGSIAEKNSMNAFIRNYFQNRNILPVARELQNVSVQFYEWSKNGTPGSVLVAFQKGLLMAGTDSSSLLKAIRQLDLPSLLEDPGYQKVKKNATENADLNIYFNHKTLPAYLYRFYKVSPSTLMHFQNYARWTEVDVIQKSNQLMINGYSVQDSMFSSYLDVFRNQQPIPGTLLKFMPSSTTFFVSQHFSNPASYLTEYKNFLKKHGLSANNDTQLAEFSRELRLNLGQYLNDFWLGEAATVLTNFNLEEKSDNRFLLLKVKPGMSDPLVAAVKKWAISNRKETGDLNLEDSGKNNIYSMPCLSFGNLIGELCFGSVETRWMTTGDGFLLFGATPGSLKRYMNLLQRGELLQEDPAFSGFTSGLARNGNFFLWSRPGESLPFFENILAPGQFQNMHKSLPRLNKIENIAWQWGFENGMVYNTASLHVNPDAIPGQYPFWRYPLSARLRGKPVFISFSDNNPQKELIFQDVENNLIDLDGDGSERWKIRLKGPIMGEMKLIDYRKSGDFQLLFNTEEAIHLISRNGVEVKNFPLKLKSFATNEIAVVDYDGKKDYRYLIACKDRKVYNFDKYGKPVSGWQNNPSAERVEYPVRYFKSGSKDYLVYFDRSRTYILDRQGKERVKVKNDFAHSGNNISLIKKDGKTSYMVTTDNQGKIRLIGFDGIVHKINSGNYSAGHIFIPVDFSGDGKYQFLIIDKQTITMLDDAGAQIFTQSLKSQIDQAPSIISFNGEKMIELTSSSENKTFLVRKDGSLFNNLLPLNSTFETMGFFNANSGVCNLIATTKNGYLSNFQKIINE